jgi:lipopolysaccharide/colanic/teichoic acid biosynthesis glycosyltransferase
MAKRLFDLLLAGAGLLVLLPLLLVIALAIKLDSRGPVFYRQVRVGRHGAEFRIHKFRTMTHDPADRGPQLTIGLDARITRVGAVLRRSKLDELAQLIDVLQGSMSLVGPRPEVPRYVALYPAELRAKVLSVRPGITDFASVEYRDESTLLAASPDPERTYREVVLPAKLALQAKYVDAAGVFTDLKLIARTLRAIL